MGSHLVTVSTLKGCLGHLGTAVLSQMERSRVDRSTQAAFKCSLAKSFWGYLWEETEVILGDGRCIGVMWGKTKEGL